MRMRFGRFSAITCVARMCASSVVPQPKASAPSPPTVLAWLSGTAWVAPGSTMPSSGATTCEMPCSGSPRSNTRMPFLAAAFAHRRRKAAPDGLVVVVAAGLGGDGVVLHREGEVGPAHRAVLLLELLEGMRRVQLMQHVAVDIDQLAAVDAPRHQMGVPDFFEQGLGHDRRPEQRSFLPSWARARGNARQTGAPAVYSLGSRIHGRNSDASKLAVTSRLHAWRRRHAALGVAPALGQGAAWPNHPVRVIVPYPAGGSTDVLFRIVADKLKDRLGQPFVVENRAGASGNVGIDAVAKSAPDGHTIGAATVGHFSINQFLIANMPYNAERDLVAPSLVYELPNVAVVATKHVPATTLAEFIAWAKARPNGISIGSPGPGTTPHLSGVLFAARTGVNAVHVPFRGAAQTIPAMLSGDVTFAVDNLASYISQIESGQMRALAVTSAKRWPTMPNVPTMEEAGVKDFVVTSWSGLCDAGGDAAGRDRQAVRYAQGNRRRRGASKALPGGRRPAPAQHAGRGQGLCSEGNQDVAGVGAVVGAKAAIVCGAPPRCPDSKKALRIDVDFELERALGLRRVGEPFAQIGREVEAARRLHQQPEAIAPAHHRERRLGRAEHAHLLVERRHRRELARVALRWRACRRPK